MFGWEHGRTFPILTGFLHFNFTKSAKSPSYPWPISSFFPLLAAIALNIGHRPSARTYYTRNLRWYKSEFSSSRDVSKNCFETWNIVGHINAWLGLCKYCIHRIVHIRAAVCSNAFEYRYHSTRVASKKRYILFSNKVFLVYFVYLWFCHHFSESYILNLRSIYGIRILAFSLNKW